MTEIIGQINNLNINEINEKLRIIQRLLGVSSKRVTSSYSILTTDDIIFANTNAGVIILKLPAVGTKIKICNVGSNYLKIIPNGLLFGSSSTFTMMSEVINITFDKTEGWW